jgi:hypothetical protein
MTAKMVTKQFPENTRNGIMVCGINHGESKKDVAGTKEGSVRGGETFFSDKRCIKFPFRSAILKWFSLWGYPLERDALKAGPYERSFFHTNWLAGRSHNIDDVCQKCIEDASQFFDTVAAFKPRIILLASVSLHDALSSEDLAVPRDACFGEQVGATIPYRPEPAKDGAKRMPRLRAKVSRYAMGTTVIAMPHPNSRPSHEYVRCAGITLDIPGILQELRDAISGK